MSKDSHLPARIKNGTVYTLCGMSFPARGTYEWVVWGLCPKCARAKKGRGK